jgi:protein TonB
MKNISKKSRTNTKRRFCTTCLLILLATCANLFLFYTLSWANNLPRNLPTTPQYTIIDILASEVQETIEPLSPESIQAVEHVNLDKSLPQPKQSTLFPAPDFQPRLPSWQPQSLSNLPNIAAAGISVAAINTASHRPSLDTGSAYSLAQVDHPPTKIKTPPPPYPYWAKQRNAQGFVDLRFVVNKNGKVSHIEAIKYTGNPHFVETAIDAVKEWLFKPASLNGKNVDVWCTQRIQFQMDD